MNLAIVPATSYDVLAGGCNAADNNSLYVYLWFAF